MIDKEEGMRRVAVGYLSETRYVDSTKGWVCGDSIHINCQNVSQLSVKKKK